MSDQQPTQGESSAAWDYPPEVVEEALRIIDQIKKDSLRMIDSLDAIDSAWSIAILAKENIPLPPNPRDGLDYPENMPSEHQHLPFFANIQQLPDAHLHTWLDFYHKEYTPDMARSQKEVKLFVALGETPFRGVQTLDVQLQDPGDVEDEIHDREVINQRNNSTKMKRRRSGAVRNIQETEFKRSRRTVK